MGAAHRDKTMAHYLGVAQFGRALRSGRKGPGFKSQHSDHNLNVFWLGDKLLKYRGVAKFGKAPGLGPGDFAGSNPAAPTKFRRVVPYGAGADCKSVVLSTQ